MCLMGVYSGKIDGEDVLGMMIKDNVSEHMDNDIRRVEKDRLLKTKNHLVKFVEEGLVSDPEYLKELGLV